MKKIILLSFLLLQGCTSVYSIKDYNSAGEYYSAINKELATKTLTLKLSDNEKSYVRNFEIKGDSAYWVTGAGYANKIISGTMIDKISPAASDNNKSLIQLKNGKTIEAYSVKHNRDSVLFQVKYINKQSIPLNKIYSISYYNHLIGTLEGLGIGAGAGFIYGMGDQLIGKLNNPQKQNSYTGITLGNVGGVLGSFLGAIAGAINGRNTVYVINDTLITNNK